MLLWAGLLLLLAGAADARPADPFQAHLTLAVGLYKQGAYEDAIREFQGAYGVRPDPRLLINIGQAQRKLGRPRDALASYEAFLRLEPRPRPEMKADLERYIAQARAMLEAAEQARRDLAAGPVAAVRPAEPGPKVAAPSPPAPAPLLPAPAPRAQTAETGGTDLVLVSEDEPEPPPAGPPPGRRPVYKQWWFWGAIGVAAAGLATGIAVGTRQQEPSVPTGLIIREPMF